jgi:hypothetical protein
VIAWANSASNKSNTALLHTADSKRVVWLNNITFDGNPKQASANINGVKLPKGNLFGRDPQLVEASASDFRLRPRGPAIGAGMGAHGVPKVDFNGNPRKVPADIRRIRSRRAEACRPVTRGGRPR